MSEAALDGLQEAADLDVTGWDLHTDKLVVFLEGGVGVAIRLVVDVASDFLGQAVSDITELFMVAVDFVWLVAVGTLAGVHFKVVGGPGLFSVDGSGEAVDGIRVETNHSLLLGGGGLGDDGRHGGAERRHVGRGSVLQDGVQLAGRGDAGAKLGWNGSDEVTRRHE